MTVRYVTVKEGQAVWFFLWHWRWNRSYRFWCPQCSWTL